MHLFEEYFLRNNISVSKVKHFRTSHCFVKNDFWKLLYINWYQEPNKVGYYNIQYTNPTSNGFKILNYQNDFKTYSKNNADLYGPVIVYYEDYEDYILSLSFKETATDSKEILIAIWEMFLRSLDENIINYNLFDKLSDTLCFEKNKVDRFKIILENIEFLHSNNLEIYNNWKNYFLPYVADYAFWLANLVKST